MTLVPGSVAAPDRFHVSLMAKVTELLENQEQIIGMQRQVLAGMGHGVDLEEDVLERPCSSLKELEELNTAPETSKEKRKKLVSRCTSL